MSASQFREALIFRSCLRSHACYSAYVNAFESVRARWWLALVVLLMGGTAGAMLGMLLTPTQYRARIAVEVTPNMGGSKINTSTNASVQSIEWTQPNMLHLARSRLSGPALADTSAIWRIRCTRDPTNRYVLCSTTSGNAVAARSVLNELVATAIPVEVASINTSFELGIGERKDQRESRAHAIQALSRTVRRLLRESKLTTSQRIQVALDRSQMQADRKLRVEMLASIFSIRRQIAGTRGSFHIEPGGATESSLSGSPAWLVGGSIGLVAAGLLALGAFRFMPFEETGKPLREAKRRARPQKARA